MHAIGITILILLTTIIFEIKISPVLYLCNSSLKGYLHEQSRPDRDKYVTIHWNNIKDGKADQFDKCEHCDVQNQPYDFESTMHYGPKDFGKYVGNVKQVTMTSKNGEKFGQRNGFSALDIKSINDLYCGKFATI